MLQLQQHNSKFKSTQWYKRLEAEIKQTLFTDKEICRRAIICQDASTYNYNRLILHCSVLNTVAGLLVSATDHKSINPTLHRPLVPSGLISRIT